MVMICPLYEGSVKTSWYPVMAVLNTTSPTVSPSYPRARPSKIVPSASANNAFFTKPLRPGIENV